MLSVKRLAAGTIVASAALLMLGTSSAIADIPLNTPSPTTDVQLPQPIAGLPSTGSQGTGSQEQHGCFPAGAPTFCI